MSRSDPFIEIEEDPIARDYVQIPRAIAQHPRLSLSAISILIWLLSKSKDWEPRMGNIQKEKRISRDGLRKVFKELETEGYATLYALPHKADGTFGGMRWKIRRHPRPEIPAVGVSGGYNQMVDSYETVEQEEKKCLPPSQARSSDDVSLSREEAIDLSTKLIQSLKTDSGGEAHAPGRENSDSARATNCVTSVTFERKLPKVRRGQLPSRVWMEDFYEKYTVHDAWNMERTIIHLLQNNRYRTVHDMEKYLAAFFEKLENDRTTPR